MKLPYPVVLASASPRRQDLLGPIVGEFSVHPADLDEEALGDPDPWVTAQRLAREKASAVFAAHPDSLVIGADTVVALGGADGWVQYAKPVDEADACRILGTLSGQTHVVVTGVAMRWPGGMAAFTETARVTFRTLSEAEIQAYVAGGEPMDKAGAYGYQGGAKAFIERLEGDINTVIGLPTERLKQDLKNLFR